MLNRLIILVLIGAGISAIATYIFTKKMNDVNKVKTIWQKYFVYIGVIIIVNIILLQDNYLFQLGFVILLGLRSFYELYKANTFLSNKMSLLFAIIIIIIASTFLLLNEAENVVHIYAFIFVFDGFSQVGGQLFGKLKITPNISSGKTYMGLLCGSIVAIIAFTFLSLDTYIAYGLPKYTMLILTMIMGCFMGDIGASYIKRNTGIKDYATIIPAHGGVLDRFDSFYGCYFACFIFQFLNIIITQYVV